MYKTSFKHSEFHERVEGNQASNDQLRENSYPLKIKNGFDFFMAFTFLIVIATWLFPLIALLIKVGSKGPVIFRQLRHGKDNKPFYCLKFRTMVVNDKADTVQAKKGDIRITKFGSFLRRSSLDELPQLINIIRGEMSLIGPRPHAVPMNEIFSDRIAGYMDRHAIKPGLTGLAQSRGYRGEIQSYQDLYFRYRLDLFYLKKWNLLLDVKILIWTAYSLLFDNKNAY
ncbi:sugar transferase [Cyclobacterium jeungdonense]|uniref:Sugar transferase n=1 Tax=Cyclobacterium jeungdonense TaxID=708087 RepID=A0ABT8C905_9BACT|nr:sugar transferase [Cyclobacterium jeungdonense]MDN3688851.1 sugar transferase [Cyclobacterium jeungdonense]